MKLLVYIIIGVALLSGATSCSTQNERKVKYAMPWMSFILSDSDLKVAKEKALKGDAESAFQVYQHYSGGKFDTISAFSWLNIAANEGNVIAQYNLGFIYMHSDIFKNIQLARFWLKEAEKNGEKEATGLLEELEESESKKIGKNK